MSSENPYPNMPRPNAENTSSAAIGAKTRIKGELQAEENLRVEGHFEGTLQLQKHQLEIGPKGGVDGTAFAHAITVEGNMDGDLYAVERISIRKGAKVKGNVMAPRVALEDGAVLRGTVEMDGDAIRKAINEKFGDVDIPTPPSKPVDSRPAAAPNPTANPAANAQPGAKPAGNTPPQAGQNPGHKPDNPQKPAAVQTPVSKQA